MLSKYMSEVTIENYFSLVLCKGILPFVKTYATKCSSYYRDIVCSCLMEAEEARRNEYKKSTENGFCQSTFHTRVIKFEKNTSVDVVLCCC